MGPRKRPSHTIIPAFAMHADGRPQMAFGVMGGPTQSQGHLQMALRVLHYGQNPQAAADAPRWRVNGGLNVALETPFDADVASALRVRGHVVSFDGGNGVFVFGSAQLVLKECNSYIAGSDPRQRRASGGVLGFGVGHLTTGLSCVTPSRELPQPSGQDVQPSQTGGVLDDALAAEALALLASGQSLVWEGLTHRFETALIRAALQATHGQRGEAAQKLGIGRNTLTRKIQELKLEGADKAGPI